MKRIISLSLVTVLLLATPIQAQAVCPLCTVVVGAGLGLSRWLGIDDTVTGIWIGGLILSAGLWLADWIGRQNWQVPWKEFLSIVFLTLLVIFPLYWLKIIGLEENTLWGINKVLLGTGVGFFTFLLGMGLDKFLRHKNDGKVHIYYQKVILPFLLLSISSFIFYFITR